MSILYKNGVNITVKISPSVLACDFTRLGEEVLAMQNAGADMIHLDVMDGRFVPNISFGPPVIKSLRKITGMLFDVHLMIKNPLEHIDAFANSGADIITFHVESESDISKTLDKIEAGGIKKGLVLKPATSADILEEFLPRLDMVLIMTVEPGFGGQKFMRDMLPKISQVSGMAAKINPALDISVDGGIDEVTAAAAVMSGANVLVAGSTLFSQPDYAKAVAGLRRSALSR